MSKLYRRIEEPFGMAVREMAERMELGHKFEDAWGQAADQAVAIDPFEGANQEDEEPVELIRRLRKWAVEVLSMMDSDLDEEAACDWADDMLTLEWWAKALGQTQLA